MSFFDQYLPLAMKHHLCLSLSILSYLTIRINKFNKCSVSVMLIATFSANFTLKTTVQNVVSPVQPKINCAKWRHKITIRWRHCIKQNAVNGCCCF